jgi:hypothetical protein
VVYALNGKTIASGAELRTVSEALKPSTPVVLHVERDGILMYVTFRSEG